MIAAVGSRSGHGRDPAGGLRGASASLRHRARWSLAALCAILAVSLAASAPALAAGRREHVFSFSFGAKGSGEGEFSDPSGVAVDNATGDVYVADRKNARVEQFKPVFKEGELVGEAFVRAFAVSAPTTVAVDNSSEGEDPSRGDVYVVSAAKAVHKFSAEGVSLGELKKFEAEGQKAKFEAIEGVAVDASGALLVYQEDGLIYTFSAAVTSEFESSMQVDLGQTGEHGFALDSEGNFYVGVEGEGKFPVISKLEGITGNLLIAELDGEDSTAVAVNPVDNSEDNGVDELNDVYVDNVGSVGGEAVTTVAEFGPEVDGEPGPLIQRFGASGLKEGDAIAVNAASGAVYVADGASDDVDVFELELPGPPLVEGVSATSTVPPAPDARRLSAQVNPTGAETHYYFEYGTGSCAAVPSPCTKAPSPAGDAGEGLGYYEASVEPTGLPSGVYHFRAVAENALGTVHSAEQTFTIFGMASGLPDGREWEMVSPVEKDGAEPEAITKEGGVIEASENGEAISYVADGPMPAKDEPEGGRNPEFTQILSTRGSKEWVTQDLATPNSSGRGIEVGVAPEYRAFSPDLALALVEPGTTPGALAEPPLSPPISPGEEQEKTIYLRDDAPLAPADSEAASYAAAKEDGTEMTPANAGFLALVTGENAPGGKKFGGGGGTMEDGLEFADATPDLSHVVFASYRAEPGLYEWGAGEKELQQVSVREGTLVGPLNAFLGGPQGYDVSHAISNDGSRVFWTAVVPHVEVGHHLYMRDTRTQETIQVDAFQGGEREDPEAPNAVFETASADGSKVFFADTQRLTANSKATLKSPDLYVFEPESGTLRDLTPVEGADIPEYEGSGGVLGASEEESEEAGNEGFNVYFVANGVLAPGATPGNCPFEQGQARPPGTTCNLYVRHYDGTEWTPTEFIAALSAEDLPDWGDAGHVGDDASQTSRVSPNGQYLAFMSERSLTGYDNEDVTSKAPGERLDEEVYLYDASGKGDASERLVCVSCDSSGARPHGVFDAGSTSTGTDEEGIGLLVDRFQVWAANPAVHDDHWLAGSVPGWDPLNLRHADYQSRYLSDSGRLFFDSPDHLVPAATGEKEKVYEYEPSGVGSCDGEAGCVGLISKGASSPGTPEHESAFLDASTSGNDVFFLTAEKLTPQDADTNFDVYDAHVCEAASPCLHPSIETKETCEEAEAGHETPPVPCKGAAAPAPGFTPPASNTASGSGNLAASHEVLGKTESKPAPPKPLTRAQKLAKALKACKKDKKKSKRQACEKQARKKYGPRKPVAKKQPSKGKK